MSIQTFSEGINALSGAGGSWTTYRRAWEEGGTYALRDGTSTLHIPVKFGDTILIFPATGHAYFTFSKSESDIDASSVTTQMSIRVGSVLQLPVPPGMKFFNIIPQSATNYSGTRVDVFGTSRIIMAVVI